jgi:toxin ParE1/3/4
MWGSDRAAAYVEGLFDTFEKIARRQVVWRPVPAEAGIQGYFVKYRSHVVYWRAASAQHVTIVSILHERMDQSSRLRRETQTWNDGDVNQ